MQDARVLAVTGIGGPGSGYAIGPRLVLASAHVVGEVGRDVRLFRPGHSPTYDGVVVWSGRPGGRDDAALVEVSDPAWVPPSGAPVRWGRLVTSRSAISCETMGVPEVAQRPGQAVELKQLAGSVNPVSGTVGNRYVMDLGQHPPKWHAEGSSPWGGVSGAALFCGHLLTGVIAADPAHSAHAALEAVPAYVLLADAAFRAQLGRHIADLPVLEPVEFQHVAESAVRTPPGGLLGSPAALLRPERQVVTFHGRDELMSALTGWSQQEGFGAWLLHGPAGQGKTRVAHELAASLAAERWAVLWPTATADPKDFLVLARAVKPLLVVLDYAEGRSSQLAAVIEAAAEHAGASRFKVLMLARTAGDWWIAAQSASALSVEWLDGTPVMALPPLESDQLQRAAAYRQAAADLARVLPTVHGLQTTDWATRSANLTPPDLSHTNLDNALTLQMTALADLLDVHGADPDVASGRRGEEVEDRLLTHERRYWDRVAAVYGLTEFGSATREEALAAALLVGAADLDGADTVLQHVPSLSGQSRDRRNAVRDWIAALYPAGPGRAWGSLHPDRLAERIIGRHLQRNPGLADRLITAVDDEQSAQLLRLYTQAAGHTIFNGSLDADLTSLVIQRHPELALAAVALAMQASRPAPLISALEKVIHQSDVTIPQLAAIGQSIPIHSQRLLSFAAEAAEEEVRRLRNVDPPNMDTEAALALALHNLAVRRAVLGDRWDGALAAAREGIGIELNLFERDQNRLPLNLFGAAGNIANILRELGLWEQSLTFLDLAISLIRSLMEVLPNVHTRDLAMALNNRANILAGMNRPQEALLSAREGLLLYRELEREGPLESPDLLKDLAIALGVVSNILVAPEDAQERLALSEEAVAISRRLTQQHSDSYLPILGLSVTRLARALQSRGRKKASVSSAEEAVAIYRDLVKLQPSAFMASLSTALRELAENLGSLGWRRRQLIAIDEAVSIRRELAEQGSTPARAALAEALMSLSRYFGSVRKYEQGLAAAEESISIFRSLSANQPEVYSPDLARALLNSALQLHEADLSENASSLLREAEEIYQHLTIAQPEIYAAKLELITSLRHSWASSDN